MIERSALERRVGVGRRVVARVRIGDGAAGDRRGVGDRAGRSGADGADRGVRHRAAGGDVGAVVDVPHRGAGGAGAAESAGAGRRAGEHGREGIGDHGRGVADRSAVRDRDGVGHRAAGDRRGDAVGLGDREIGHGLAQRPVGEGGDPGHHGGVGRRVDRAPLIGVVGRASRLMPQDAEVGLGHRTRDVRRVEIVEGDVGGDARRGERPIAGDRLGHRLDPRSRGLELAHRHVGREGARRDVEDDRREAVGGTDLERLAAGRCVGLLEVAVNIAGGPRHRAGRGVEVERVRPGDEARRPEGECSRAGAVHRDVTAGDRDVVRVGDAERRQGSRRRHLIPGRAAGELRRVEQDHPSGPWIEDRGTSKPFTTCVTPATPSWTTPVVAPPLPIVSLPDPVSPPLKLLKRVTMTWLVVAGSIVTPATLSTSKEVNGAVTTPVPL